MGIPHWKNRCLGVLPGESWLPILGYEGKYEISDLGRVKSLKRNRPWRNGHKPVSEKILTQVLLNTGYPKVGLSKDGIPSPHNLHQLVAIHFISNPHDLPEVNHKKRIKTDNRRTTLEWSSQYDNIMHAKRTGLDKAIAETHYITKFKNSDVIEIFMSSDSISDLAKRYSVTYQCIWAIKRGRWWKSVTQNLNHAG